MLVGRARAKVIHNYVGARARATATQGWVLVGRAGLSSLAPCARKIPSTSLSPLRSPDDASTKRHSTGGVNFGTASANSPVEPMSADHHKREFKLNKMAQLKKSVASRNQQRERVDPGVQIVINEGAGDDIEEGVAYGSADLTGLTGLNANANNSNSDISASSDNLRSGSGQRLRHSTGNVPDFFTSTPTGGRDSSGSSTSEIFISKSSQLPPLPLQVRDRDQEKGGVASDGGGAWSAPAWRVGGAADVVWHPPDSAGSGWGQGSGHTVKQKRNRWSQGDSPANTHVNEGPRTMV